MEYHPDLAREILSRTPATLSSLLRGLPTEWTHSNEGPETWSPFDVVGHLIHSESVNWIPRATRIIRDGEDHPFEPFDRFAMFEASKGRSIDELLTTFERLRHENLRQLDELDITLELLAKRGTHPDLGVVTLGNLLSTWVAHDLGHIGQIVRVMARQYTDAVGPWRAFLPSLTR